MGTVRYELETFEVLLKQDTDKDEPYIWVLGLILDQTNLDSYLSGGSPEGFIVRKNPSAGNLGTGWKKGDIRAIDPSLGVFSKTVWGITAASGELSAGVLVMALEHDHTGEDAIKESYDLVVAELGDFVAGKVDTFSKPTAAELEAFRAEVREDVSSVMKSGTPWYNLITGGADDFVGSDLELFKVTGGTPLEKTFTLRFSTGSTDYRIVGNMKYTP